MEPGFKLKFTVIRIYMINSFEPICCTVVEPVDCKNESSSDEYDVTQQEHYVIKRYATIAASKDLQEQGTLGEINQVIHEKCHADINMVHMKHSKSILCYMSCGTPQALQVLYNKIGDGTLKEPMQDIFGLLNGHLTVVNVSGRLSVSKRLSESELAKRKKQFSEHLGE